MATDVNGNMAKESTHTNQLVVVSNSLPAEDSIQRNLWDLGFLRVFILRSNTSVTKLVPIAAFKPDGADRHSDYIRFQHDTFLAALRTYSVQVDPTNNHTLTYYYRNGTDITACDLLEKGGFQCALGDWASRPHPSSGISPMDVSLRSNLQPTGRISTKAGESTIPTSGAQRKKEALALLMENIPCETRDMARKRKLDLSVIPPGDGRDRDLQSLGAIITSRKL